MPRQLTVVIVPVIMLDHIALRDVHVEVASGMPEGLDQHRITRYIGNQLAIRDNRKRSVPCQSEAVAKPEVEVIGFPGEPRDANNGLEISMLMVTSVVALDQAQTAGCITRLWR